MMFGKKEFPKQLLCILVSLLVGMVLFSVVVSHYSKAYTASINLNIVDNVQLLVWSLERSYGAIGKYGAYIGLFMYFSFWLKWGLKIYWRINKG
ncbi:hypothetical protein OAT16_03480 [Prolixibacteraceae bacterium]|nr:hypothetical protein [Prolixibacteraceae bacterium]